MKFSAKEIAQLINGTVVGDESKSVSTFSKIEEATEESICFFANEKYAQFIPETKAAIILVNCDFAHYVPNTTTLIQCENPYEAAAQLLKYYETKISNQGIETNAQVSTKANIGSNVYIAGFAYISDYVNVGDETKIFPHVFIGKNAKIGKNVILYSGVKIYEGCVIGDNCILHSGAVIGSDGFGFAPDAQGNFTKIPQVGNVVLEDNVEIGANTVIDRATMGSTLIKQGTKLDNLIQIAHNVVIGRNTVIAAQTGIAGSTKVGDYVMIGGQASIIGHIDIANKVRINAKTGVSKSLKEGESVSGYPVMGNSDFLKSQALFKRLPELFERLLRLEKKD
jgi:UDP-3-O-[3-hydroxymyristoyl] glucosamine N-acyltransferase